VPIYRVNFGIQLRISHFRALWHLFWLCSLFQQALTKRNHKKDQIRIAIAQDPAFNFYYADNLDLLKDMGAELIPWSPIKDKSIPEDIHGLYFGGGFPEVFARHLTENLSARASVKAATLSSSCFLFTPAFWRTTPASREVFRLLLEPTCEILFWHHSSLN
jgi:hypothetical protein